MAVDLEADCERCVGLCCVALPFAATADFAIDKPAGVPCPNLQPDHRCGIHDRLEDSGFPGCVTYDCFGAGQQVTQVVFGGGDWRTTPSIRAPMFAVFPVVRQLHELLWLVAEASSWASSAPVQAPLGAAAQQVEALVAGTPQSLAGLDVGPVRAEVGGLLRDACRLVWQAAGGPGPDLAGADLVGTDQRGRDLRCADLRGALLVGADLRGADLRQASFLGADLRGADLRGAHLAGALLLTASQRRAART